VLVPHRPHRGHNRQVVFLADEDYQCYLDNLAECWSRNQLTGNQHLVDETERRIGERVEQRGLGRLKST